MRKRANSEEAEDVPKRSKNEEAIDLDSDDSGDFGPALPGPAQKGPSLPPQFRKMLAEQNPLYEENADLEKYAKPIEEVMATQPVKGIIRNWLYFYEFIVIGRFL